jgi:hypothetical protein
VAAGTWQRIADVKSASSGAGWLYEACTNQKSLYHTNDDCRKELHEAYALRLEGSWENVAVLSLVPIPIAWIAVLGVVGVSRWVRAGFDERKEHKQGGAP